MGVAGYLCAASSILSCTTGYELRIVVLEQVFIEAHVLFFGEDSIVGLESVLLEKGFISVTAFINRLGFGTYGRTQEGYRRLPFALDVFTAIDVSFWDFMDDYGGMRSYLAMDSLSRAGRTLPFASWSRWPIWRCCGV